MRFVLLYSLAALATCSSALAVPAPGAQQASIGNSAKDDDDYDLEPSANFAFSGITTFSKLPSVQCLTEAGPVDDILILGFPFDTATSYRTGTRLGPNAVRQGSRAASLAGHYNYRQSINPYKQNISVVDCGDLPISPFDNGLAFAQMEDWYKRLLWKELRSGEKGIKSSKTGRSHPQIIALGGDHSISLPILRALNTVYGKVSAIHIDAHIDTWSPKVFAGAKAGSKQAQFADGTPYYWAGMEGLLSTKNVHAGIRSSLDSAKDMELDQEVGFTTIPASDMLKRDGVWGVINKIRSVISHDEPVYVSLDVDCLDPAFVPGTAGPASGGWTPREIIQIIIDALDGLNIVGVDVVEVLPALDQAEITGIVAAEFTIELITRLVKNRLGL
ncbi:agmatinase [Cladophialophora bantiana CBS 173.52]|uniref:Agmatinase n=1 Tax=Cladophialophora bantiana (strain ATCC 10958 / CBS 173.52 / CDC B-1940 / NIH 8579) TaxID=1442370 RepID=A0A0D2HL38_CLAB1|nr:agmatinase [Cladophialophora bantiana CBS 173.52]KIW91455.1 agmatinase [Cladophialophora bantiana CBS 173.52]